MLKATTKNNPWTASEVRNQIICGDVLESLKRIPDGMVTLAVTSPPYNTDIAYASHDDNMTWHDYLDWLKEVWTECARTLRPGGRLVVNIDAITNWDDDRDSEYTRPIYAELVNMMREIDDINFRTEIMWCKAKNDPELGQVVGRATAWGSYLSCSNPVVMRNHEYLLVWSKGQWALPGDAENSDMTEDEFLKYTRSTWCVQPESRKLGGHPVPYPEELMRRVIKLFSYRGDVVLDPFNGSGTTTSAAASLMRGYIGIDLEEKYCAFAEKRARQSASTGEQAEQFNPYVNRSDRMEATKKAKQKKARPVEKDLMA